MNVEYVESELIEEPITIDYEAHDKQVKPKPTSGSTVKMDGYTLAKINQPRYKPIERKPKRTKPIRSSLPIEDTVFACLEDYLAAINA